MRQLGPSISPLSTFFRETLSIVYEEVGKLSHVHVSLPDQFHRYPLVPKAGGGVVDWSYYPREKHNGDLCTLRIRPDDKIGWMLVENRRKSQCLVYAWERAKFPWLMTWEENHSRADKPWCKRTLSRGLEFTR